MTVSIANEYLWWDNVETVRVAINVDGELKPQKELDYALRVNPSNNRSSYQGMRTSSLDVTFWLPIAELGTNEPDGNMVLIDSNNKRYALRESKKISLGSSDSHWDVLMTRYQDEA